jgi:arylsulfatase A-like enzyme/Tfp pilus assembly protein PilF
VFNTSTAVIGTQARSLAVVLAVLLGTSCAREEEAPNAAAPQRGVPVFIISIDTLRPDHLPAYGYKGVQTPAIDRLRSDGVLFRYAFSHCPQTLPAHASLLTGQLPPTHGVRDNIGYTLQSSETLASILRSRGYATGAAISSYVLRRASGVSAGFGFFDDTLDYEAQLVKTSAQRDGEQARAALEGWLAQTTGPRVFGFLHLYEPHAPYEPPAPYDQIADRYDGEIAYSDAIVGRFIEFLRQRGLYDDALIVLLSDHGEGLGDHGEGEHGLFIYRESVQVPLIVKLPAGSRRGETIERAVGLVDVLPTILNQIGVASPAKLEGSDLLAIGTGPRRIYTESYFARLHFGWHELKGLIDDRFHVIDAPRREIYAYREDPAETKNLLEQQRRVAFAMAKELEAFGEFEPPSAVDPEDQRKLAALGYIGSAAGGSGPAADPKDKIDVFADLRKCFELVLNGQASQALPTLRKLVAKEPGIADAWWLLSQSLRASGKKGEALAALQRGMDRFPTNANLVLSAADLLYEMGRYEKGRAQAELAMKIDPVLGGELLGRSELKRGDLVAAARGAETALAAAPERTETLMLLADIARKRRRPEEELRYLDRAVSAIRARNLAPVESLHFRRGEALLGAGRVPESEAAFRAETERFRNHRQAWSSLALVVGAQGRRDEARAILGSAIESNPDRRMLALALESLEAMSDPGGARQLEREFGRRM